MPVHFFKEEIDFSLSETSVIVNWLTTITQNHNQEIEELNYIFCDDSYLLTLNQEYLSHDTLTDIITFDNSEEYDSIEGDIYISIDRVRENANTFNLSFENELYRVMAHGLLHLLGYNDKTEEQRQEMRKKEEACLSLLANLE